MKIIDISSIRELDSATIEKEPIKSIDLMERASQKCVDWIVEKFELTNSFVVFCGLGNNGGDGLAIARLLSEKGYLVQVFIIRYSDKNSADFLLNYERILSLSKDNLKVEDISDLRLLKTTFSNSNSPIIIDALIGSGLNKVAEGMVQETISFINQQPQPVVSIDCPSGLFCDQLNGERDPVVNANFTLTFQLPKLSFMYPENAKHTGEFSILNIQLNTAFLNGIPTQNYFTTRADVLPFLKTRNKIAHKGNFGHALIMAGSIGKVGAAVLAAKACLRTGVGLLTVHSPGCGLGIIQASIPEAMVSVDSEETFLSETGKLEKYNAIGIGPGIGLEKQSQNVLKLIIQNTTVPLLLDADAINILSENKTWIAFLPKDSILTPHLKEFERLAGSSKNSEERLQIQREFSIKKGIYIVLKGAHTSISFPNGEIHFNSTGNPGMATAGSGDVLSGIITSLMAQGYSSSEACLLGVYLHGLAGDFAAFKKTEENMIASDIIENLTEGYQFLKR